MVTIQASSIFRCKFSFIGLLMIICCYYINKCYSTVSWCPHINGCAGYDWCYAKRCRATETIFDHGCYKNSEVPEEARRQQNGRDWCYAHLATDVGHCGLVPPEELQLLCYSCNTDGCDAASCTKDFCVTTTTTSTKTTEIPINSTTIMTTKTTTEMPTDSTTMEDQENNHTTIASEAGTEITPELPSESSTSSSEPTTSTTLETSSSTTMPNKIQWTFPPYNNNNLPLFRFEFAKESSED